MVTQSIVYYYDHMNLIYSFECFLIIADTKIKRHEKVRMINFFMALNFRVCDYPERNKFQQTAKHAIKCYWPSTPRALLRNQSGTGTSEKIIGYPALHTSMLKTCFHFNDFPKALTSLQFMTNSFH